MFVSSCAYAILEFNNLKIKRTFLRNVGFECTYNKRKLIAQGMAISKEGVHFSEKDLKNLIKHIAKYLDSIAKVDVRLKEPLGKIHDNTIFDNDALTFQKYISEKTYEKYIAKGKFQLGSLRLYREIEKKESRDEKEGFSNLLINAGSRDIFVPVISGFNYYVLCGSHAEEYSQNRANKFGKVMITVKNVRSFAESIMKSIGAIRWYIRRVDYSDFKSYRINQIIKNMPKAGFDMNEELFECLLNASTLPSIFVKPMRFSDENELRLVFEMPKDAKKQLSLHNKGLLQYIDKKA